GRGDADAVRRTLAREAREARDSVTFLGLVDEQTRGELLASANLYVAPNTGGESFGIILTEAMSAGAPVVASDLNAFRRVLDDGRAGVLTPVGDPAALAGALCDLLTDPGRRTALAAAGRRRVAAYDWTVVAGQVLRVYEQAIAADPRRVGESGLPA
ncbi:glycosyltransferase family 4 protein, partial [Actinophytocola sp.]|uniref:glycosyltransferase family 4 protein n=1 Tax=Actinophytocola sp. TaxID=1872138 RepID=UPI002D80EA3B